MCTAVLCTVPQQMYLWGAHETSHSKLSSAHSRALAQVCHFSRSGKVRPQTLLCTKCPADIGAARRGQKTKNGDPPRSAGILSQEQCNRPATVVYNL